MSASSGSSLIICSVHQDDCVQRSACRVAERCLDHRHAIPVLQRAGDTIITPAGPVDLNPKDLAGCQKPQLGLIPTSAMVPVARVMELGAKKYGPYNWRYTPIGLMTYLHAMKRHIEEVINGVDTDPESGESHLAHVASGAMIVLDAKAQGTLREDRPTVVEIKPEPKSA